MRLWERWNDAEANALAADNLFLDTSAAERRKEIEKIKTELGACRVGSYLEPDNWLRGKFRMSCERGSVDVVFTMSPTMPPKLQFLRFFPTQGAEVRSADAGCRN